MFCAVAGRDGQPDRDHLPAPDHHREEPRQWLKLAQAALREAERELEAATTKSELNAAAKLGPSALLDANSILVSVISHQTTAIDLDAFAAFGLVPHHFAIIVLRSKTHFRAVHEPLAEAIIIADTPDWGRADLATLPYRPAPPDILPLARG